MRYEIRKTPKNKWQLREKPKPYKKTPGVPVGDPKEVILGEFDTLELAADFALAHTNGDFNWKPFDPAAEGSAHRREVLEGNLRG